MKYQEYIDLGFTRIELHDSIEMRDTGYSGYYLQKNITDHVYIGVSYGELDKPKLFVKKQNSNSSE